MKLQIHTKHQRELNTIIEEIKTLKKLGRPTSFEIEMHERSFSDVNTPGVKPGPYTGKEKETEMREDFISGTKLLDTLEEVNEEGTKIITGVITGFAGEDLETVVILKVRGLWHAHIPILFIKNVNPHISY